MTTPLINPMIIELSVKVPVSVIRAHFSTAVEMPEPWFRWSEIQLDGEDSPIQAKLTYWDYGDERNIKTRVVTDRDFAIGLQAFLRIHGTTTEVQYQGDGEWDIDAAGADAIMQYVVYEELLLS